MVFDNVSFTSLPLCLGNLSGVFIQNGYGQDGVVSVTLDEFAAQACSVPIKCKGCSLTCASIIIAEKSQSGRAHVVCGNGTGHVELGTTAIPIECLITPVSQAWRLVSHAVGRYTSNGLAGVGGVWEDLSGNFKFSWGWFSGGWILPIVVVLLSVLMLGKSATLVVIVLVFAFCDIDAFSVADLAALGFLKRVPELRLNYSGYFDLVDSLYRDMMSQEA